MSVTKDTQINSLNETVVCKIAPSPIHGLGVFTIRDVAKGKKLHCIPSLHPPWYDLTYADLGKLFPEVRELVLARWPSIIHGSHFLSPNQMALLITFMNHSDTPNYEVDTDTALRDIKAGEEVTEDYRRMKDYKKVYPWL